MNLISAEEARKLCQDYYDKEDEVRRIIEDINFKIRKEANRGNSMISYPFEEYEPEELTEVEREVIKTLENAGYEIDTETDINHEYFYIKW